MKASELVKEVQKCIEIYGDLDVVVYSVMCNKQKREEEIFRSDDIMISFEKYSQEDSKVGIRTFRYWDR